MSVNLFYCAPAATGNIIHIYFYKTKKSSARATPVGTASVYRKMLLYNIILYKIINSYINIFKKKITN